jgi:hypothetical protein
MNKTIGKGLFLAVVLSAPAVIAQTETPAVEVAPNGEAAATSAPSEGSPAAAAPAAVSAPAASDPALAAKVAELEAKLKGIEEAGATRQATLDKLSKLKVSGFIQARYEWNQDAVNGWNFVKNSTGDKDYFYVRRARLDTVYSGTNAEYVLQIDAGNGTFATKDIEAAFIDTWTPLHLRISVGQFKYPFGYELQQPDPVREMPERSSFILKYFPGERDRGLKVQGSYDILRFQVALINGNGTQDTAFGILDSNKFKDVVGRLGVDHGFVAGGVSAWYGTDDLDTSNTDPTKWLKYSRIRVGGDVQGYIDVPSVGNLSLRGETLYSRDKNQAYNGVAASSCQDRIGWGWSLIAAQNIGQYVGAVVRVDGYDPLIQSTLDSVQCAGTTAKPGTYVTAGKDRIITYGGGLLAYVSPNLKASFIYEHPTEQSTNKVDNDKLTAQLQSRF